MEIIDVNVKVFAETYYINAFSVLWHTKVHSIYNLRGYHVISNLVQMIKNGSQRSSFIMNHKTFYILQEKCFGLVSAKYFLYLKK